MKNIYLNIYKPNSIYLKKVKKNIENNNVIGLPTETVYGLAGNAYSERSVKKIYKLKAEASQTYPFTGKSTVTSLSFNFLDGAKIILACYKMDKEAKKNQSFLKSVLKQNDSFRIDVRSSTFVNYLKKLNL